MNIKYNFENRNVIITGAGSGIGRITAIKFLESGANVALLSKTEYPDLSNLLTTYSSRAKFYKINLELVDDLFKVLEKIKDDFQKIHVLVNNASIFSRGMVEDISIDTWDKVYAVNVRSYFLTIKYFLASMKKNKYGKIINVSSIAGRDKSMLLGAAYTSSKAATIGLTRQIAAEVAKFNINVNCIAPSQTDTPMLRKILTPDLKKMIEQRNPSGYIASPEQIANVILFLTSDEANYINGAVIDINGGLY